MYGKLFGAMVGAIVALLLAPPLELPELALFTSAVVFLASVLGHFFGDRRAFARLVGRRGASHGAAPPGADAPSGLGRRPGAHGARGKRGRAGASAVSRAPAEGRAPTPAPASDEERARRRALGDALVPLFVEVARADAPLSADEARVIRAFLGRELGLDDGELARLQPQLVAAGAAPPGDLEALARAARGPLAPALRVDVVRWLYDVALADGPLAKSEGDALRRVVDNFNLAEEQLQAITRQRFGEGLEHYRALGLAPSASDEEIRSAFRRLATEHHPDRAGPSGASDAAARFRAIKDAYDALRLLRGL